MNITKAIPIPKRKGGGFNVYPWERLGVGDSFFAKTIITNMSSVATNAARRLGTKYTCRSVEEDGVKGVRVWRIR